MLTACVFTFGSVKGQAPNFAPQCKQQLQKLAALSGKWKGSGTVSMGPGRVETFAQTEDVQFKLDSTILQIEGIGRRQSGNEVAFNALAIINFDVRQSDYTMRSYLRDGRWTDAWFKVVEKNSFTWGYDLPGNAGQIRYTITLNDAGQTWQEIGEFSSDGSTWHKVFEMNLTKEL